MEKQRSPAHVSSWGAERKALHPTQDELAFWRDVVMAPDGQHPVLCALESLGDYFTLMCQMCKGSTGSLWQDLFPTSLGEDNGILSYPPLMSAPCRNEDLRFLAQHDTLMRIGYGLFRYQAGHVSGDHTKGERLFVTDWSATLKSEEPVIAVRVYPIKLCLNQHGPLPWSVMLDLTMYLWRANASATDKIVRDAGRLMRELARRSADR